jgi:hypothetical protein
LNTVRYPSLHETPSTTVPVAVCHTLQRTQIPIPKAQLGKGLLPLIGQEAPGPLHVRIYHPPILNVDRHIKLHLSIHFAIIGVLASHLHSRTMPYSVEDTSTPLTANEVFSLSTPGVRVTPQPATPGLGHPPTQSLNNYARSKQHRRLGVSRTRPIHLSDSKPAALSSPPLFINPRSGKYVSDPLREGTTVIPSPPNVKHDPGPRDVLSYLDPPSAT